MNHDDDRPEHRRSTRSVLPSAPATSERTRTKLNLELDTSVSVFKWLPENHWLRGVELDASLDYVATGLPRVGDRIDDLRFLDDASARSDTCAYREHGTRCADLIVLTTGLAVRSTERTCSSGRLHTDMQRRPQR